MHGAMLELSQRCTCGLRGTFGFLDVLYKESTVEEATRVEARADLYSSLATHASVCVRTRLDPALSRYTL